MKCPRCGAPSDVQETRKKDDGRTVQRSRLCFNGHRFPSFEVYGPIYRRDPSNRRSALRAAEERTRRWQRDQTIAMHLRNGMSYQAIMDLMKVSFPVVSHAAHRTGRAHRSHQGKPSVAPNKSAPSVKAE